MNIKLSILVPGDFFSPLNGISLSIKVFRRPIRTAFLDIPPAIDITNHML